MNLKKKGFTLIELLVVIAIIAIIASIILISLSSVRNRAKDSKTISQLSQIPSKVAIDYYTTGTYDICENSSSFKESSGLKTIENEIEERNGTITCYSEGTNYCISTQLLQGDYYVIKNNQKITSSIPCSSATTGGGYWGDSQCGESFTDSRDNKTYTTVLIGTQCWMKENLAYLPVVHSNAEFAAKGTALEPGYGVYGYDGSDVPTAKATTNYQTYGVLYNWHASLISCPEDWHLPTDAEQHTLDNFLKDAGQTCNPSRNNAWDCSTAGAKMKTASWGGNNSSGFTALPSGYRTTGGSFLNIGSHAFYWSSLESSSSYAWRRSLSSTEPRVYRGAFNKAYGFSVRCLRDN